MFSFLKATSLAKLSKSSFQRFGNELKVYNNLKSVFLVCLFFKHNNWLSIRTVSFMVTCVIGICLNLKAMLMARAVFLCPWRPERASSLISDESQELHKQEVNSKAKHQLPTRYWRYIIVCMHACNTQTHTHTRLLRKHRDSHPFKAFREIFIK